MFNIKKGLNKYTINYEFDKSYIKSEIKFLFFKNNYMLSYRKNIIFIFLTISLSVSHYRLSTKLVRLFLKLTTF